MTSDSDNIQAAVARCRELCDLPAFKHVAEESFIDDLRTVLAAVPADDAEPADFDFAVELIAPTNYSGVLSVRGDVLRYTDDIELRTKRDVRLLAELLRSQP